MFTIKFYRDDGYRQRILEAESFTILRDQMGNAEITLHRQPGPNGEYRDERFDINHSDPQCSGMPERFDRAVIENALGKTSEIVTVRVLCAAGSSIGLAA